MKPPAARISHTYFPAFDVFRGIGILFVVAAHTPVQSAVLAAIRPIGVLGVHMFFALSGFLITYRLIEEHDQTGGVDLKAFYRRRARRILPPAAIYLAVLTVLGPVLHWLPTRLNEIAACLFFYRNVFQPAEAGAWYTGHFWSLSLEEQFYLFWPVLLAVLGARRGRTRWVALGLVLATVVWRIYVFSVNPAADIYRPDLLADHLLWGCLVALLWGRIHTRVAAPVRTLVGIAGIAAATLLIYRQPAYWQPFFALSVALGFILSAEASGAWAMRWTPFRKLGEASYDVYIWQSLFLPLPFLGMAMPLLQRLPWSYLGIAAVTTGSFLLTFPKRRRVTSPR